jgi:hypothetical protein
MNQLALKLAQLALRIYSYQDCSCSDEDSDGYCWYHLTDEQKAERLAYMIERDTDFAEIVAK